MSEILNYLKKQPAGYLSEYLTYTTTDEAPVSFHFWAGMSALSAALGRRVWIRRGEEVTYANLYVLLVGPAGNGKSYAMTKARRLLIHLPEVIQSSSVETVEGLIAFMSGASSPTDTKAKTSPCAVARMCPNGREQLVHELLVVANEFVDFIRVNSAAWTGFFNNIYDEDVYSYRTKQGFATLHGPYLSLLGALPTEISAQLQQLQIISSGFARRTIFQYGERRFDCPVPDPIFNEEQEKAKEYCINFLRNLSTISGEYVRTPEAVAWWHLWYREHSMSLKSKATSAVAGWLASKPTQVLKLSLLMAICRSRKNEIHPQDFEDALFYLNEMEKSLHKVFRSMGRNPLAGLIPEVERWIEQQTSFFLEKQLRAVFYANFSPGRAEEECREVIAQLLESKKLFSMQFPRNAEKTTFATIYGTQAILEQVQKDLDSLTDVSTNDGVQNP